MVERSEKRFGAMAPIGRVGRAKTSPNAILSVVPKGARRSIHP